MCVWEVTQKGADPLAKGEFISLEGKLWERGSHPLLQGVRKKARNEKLPHPAALSQKERLVAGLPSADLWKNSDPVPVETQAAPRRSGEGRLAGRRFSSCAA